MPEEHKESGPGEPFLDIDTSTNGSISCIAGYILVIIFAVLICGFAVYYKFYTHAAAVNKAATLEKLISTLQSTDNSQVEKQVNDINEAIRILRTEKKSKYLFKSFMDELKAKTTNDVKLNNLSIDSDGGVSIDGESLTYKSVAELAISLKSSHKLEGVEIKSLSRSSSDENKSYINFSITAKLSDWKSADSSEGLAEEVESGGSVNLSGGE